MAAAGSLLFWLMATSIADAAPARRHNARAPRVVCGSRVESRPFIRTAFLRPTHRLVPRRIIAKLRRNRVKLPTDDDKAIQNAAAVDGSNQRRPLTVLEPIGMLIVSQHQPTSHRTVSRPSPRGPPSSPA